ncbi:hypothetical protein N0V85_004847 [Neurospora sp. IMI 360204]|nr:hypothetical protein N0V85_004847 [Neurospora sp. IMI 360204]
MLEQRGWTEGVDFVDWKKAEQIPDTPKPSGETRDTENSDTENSDTENSDTENSDTENPDTEDPETLALSVDWKPSKRALDNGLHLCDIEGMGPYPDWDEVLGEPVWRAHGISKIPRDRWGHALGRQVQEHVFGGWVEGHGQLLFEA